MNPVIQITHKYRNPVGILISVIPLCRTGQGRMILCHEPISNQLLNIYEDLLIPLNQDTNETIH